MSTKIDCVIYLKSKLAEIVLEMSKHKQLARIAFEVTGGAGYEVAQFRNPVLPE